jgi:hypothetical protein
MTTNIMKKAAGAINSNGPHTDTNSIDFLTAAALEQAPSGKSIATEIARLALAGHAIHKGSAGDFTVCKYGLAKYFQDFAELQAFSRKLGVSK